MTDQLTLILNKEQISAQNPLVFLRNFIDQLRPANPFKVSGTISKLASVTQQLQADEELNVIFSSKIAALVVESKKAELFTQVNFLASKGLLSELRLRLFTKILPKVESTGDLKGIINRVFHKRTDHIWLELLSAQAVNDFLLSLKITPVYELGPEQQVVDDLLSNIYIISQVICSLSIDVNIVKNYSEVLEINSPFMLLHEHIDRWIEGLEHKNVTVEKTEETYQKIIAAIQSCIDFIEKIKQNKNTYGTSIALTLVIQKLTGCIERMNDLIHLVVVTNKNEYVENVYGLTKKIVRTENLKNSLRTYFNDTMSLLAFQITEHTGKIGEHYVTSTAKEYFQMFWDALKGGLVVGFMVIIKYLINALHLPLLQDTLLKGLNYSLGFIGIQLIHGTLATKQPSMTAATIAHSIENRSESEGIKELGDFIIKVFRSQFIAVLGNLIIAFPVSMGLSYAWFAISGHHIATEASAVHKIHDLNPIASLCLLHAAIAGVMLFICGILAGIAENANVFGGYSTRIKKHRILRQVIGKKRTEAFGEYIGNNIGGLTGNFTLGFFLAFVAFFGAILGLPLDIQHVTFASGNLGLSLAATMDHIHVRDLLMAIAGVILIGTVNILVSFSLAMVVAIKSRGIKLRRTGSVIAYLGRQFFKHPLQFFIPK
ncbi:MAG: site-specific recombinase [Bacteroidetes bacterium]|nr:site-specific recombinase [Bacteroidota bacterium]